MGYMFLIEGGAVIRCSDVSLDLGSTAADRCAGRRVKLLPGNGWTNFGHNGEISKLYYINCGLCLFSFTEVDLASYI
jgi:hypothetical protein